MSPCPRLPAVVAVAEDSVKVAQLLQRGELVGAMDVLIPMVDSVGTFLGQIRLAVGDLEAANPQLAQACAQYYERLDSVVDRMQTSLESRDLVGLALVLEHGVAKALRDYEYFDRPLATMLGESTATRAA